MRPLTHKNESDKSYEPAYHLESTGVDHNPCPSSECWIFESGTCELKSECVTLTCLSSKIEVTLLPEVFEDWENVQPVGFDEVETVRNQTKESAYRLSCLFGDCGMTHEIKNDQ